MTRLLTFLFVRVIALLWVLALANVARRLDPWSISAMILASEALLGFTWGRAESRITACKPKTPDPKRLFVLMACVAIVESIGAVLLVQMFAPWLIVWRVVTAYLPFVLVEFFVFRRLCRPSLLSG
ncbi:MAG TPA: hypothetical protein VN397_04380 [Candidatus Methylomirabilis sp.]|nr:hypothetical protein [Candidatus Methylomirabilis sp.]